MSQSTTASATKPEVDHNTTQTAQEASAPPAPVLISEQEVMFGTRVAVSPRKGSIPRRWFDAVRGAGALAAAAAAASALPGGHGLPGAVADGSRNGPAVIVFQYDWVGSPRLDALLHELGASLRRDFGGIETSATASPSPNSELPSRSRPCDA